MVVAQWCLVYALTPTETLFLRAAVEGVRREELAAVLGVSANTAKKHIQNLLAKTGDTSLLAATARALRQAL